MSERYVLTLRKTGLGDRIICLCAAWKYARDTNRTLIVDWRHSRYSKTPDNLFPDCFTTNGAIGGVKLVAGAGIETCALPGPIFPQRWGSENRLASPWLEPADGLPGEREAAVELMRSGCDIPANTIVFNTCVNDGIVLLKDAKSCLSDLKMHERISAAASDFLRQTPRPDHLIGMHIRHGNDGVVGHAKSWTSFDRAISRCQTAVNRARSRVGQDVPVLLCTDSIEVQTTVLKRIPNTIVRPKFFRPAGSGELHLGADAYLGFDDALIEMELLSRCDTLIRYPAGSFFSFYPAVMKRSTETDIETVYDLMRPSEPGDPLSPAILY
ncbi:MAG TPA: nodulation protein NodZ [Methylovirgula sp.]